MNIRRIVPNISSSQMEASKAFYAGFLELKLVMDMGWILTFASDSNPTAQISVEAKDSVAVPNEDITISIEVEDVDRMYTKAMALGYPIVYPIADEPWGVRRFFVKDPNGIIVNIMSHIPTKE